MEYGIAIVGTANSAKIAQHAEELGFRSVSFSDSPTACGDLFVAMASSAMTTSRIRLGSWVCVPWTRNPAATACGFSSINALAPGRIDIRLGTGFSGRRCFGLNAMKLKDFADYVRALMGLLRGEEVEVEIEGAPRGIKMMHPNVINLKDPIRVHIAASGPKIRDLTAELGLAVVDTPSVFSSDDNADMFGDMRKAWRDAGRDESDLYITVGGSFIVLRDGEARDSERVRKIGGPLAMAAVHYWADDVMLRGKSIPDSLPETMKTAINAYIAVMESRRDEPGAMHIKIHEGHVLFVRGDEEDIVNQDLIERANFIGTPDEIRERAHVLEKAGANELIVGIRVGHESAIDDLAKAIGLKAPKTYSVAS